VAFSSRRAGDENTGFLIQRSTGTCPLVLSNSDNKGTKATKSEKRTKQFCTC
jgi:hypothetical protein